MIIEKALPPTFKRVLYNTPPEINEDIREKTLENLSHFQGDIEELISARIKSLQREWDTERFLETSAASLIILGSVLGLRSGRLWHLFTGAVGASLLLHALEGWCPPLPAIRRCLIRTADEINKEKTVLKMMRGDFSQEFNNIEEMLTLAEKE